MYRFFGSPEAASLRRARLNLGPEHGWTCLGSVIHMGAGAVDAVVQAAIRNYGEYRRVTDDGLGLLAVSVFAVAKGVPEQQILAVRPTQRCNNCVGVVQDAGFEVWATTVEDADLDRSIEAIQPVHFDIVLRLPAAPRLAAVDPIDDEDLAEAVASATRRSPNGYWPCSVPDMAR
ncbi:MAG: hypothetical protein U5R31_03860 [Acidimicrobiia bacterium]|nr:hypothetical protein [Acidimicrobiia bacterium]